MRTVHAAEKNDYDQRGACVVRNVVPMAAIERMRAAIDRVLAAPGDASVEYTPADKQGRYYGDRRSRRSGFPSTMRAPKPGPCTI